jgi:hypothetical protein
MKEVSPGSQIKHKRGPYIVRDDDVQLMHAKHQKGPQTTVGEASKRVRRWHRGFLFVPDMGI